VLEDGGLLIDTPGMRELGMLGTGEGLGATFADINALAQRCRYADCRHASEPGCAVRAAIDRHEMSEEHLRNFLKLQKEVEFNDRSYVDRRKKDRAFGRFLHTYNKQKDGRSGD
jgi:ribosome biogenesis GTPase